jgi:hypothetical protein
MAPEFEGKIPISSPEDGGFAMCGSKHGILSVFRAIIQALH